MKRNAAIGTTLIIMACLSVVSLVWAADTLPRRGYLGAQIRPVTDSIRTATGADFDGGLILAKILPGGSAEKGGLKDGDIILTVAGEPVQNPQGFFKIFNRHKGGSKVELGLLRNQKKITKTLALLPYPKEQPGDFDVLYETVTVRDSLRRLLVTRPRGEGKFPVVLMVGGIGCYSLDVIPGSSGVDPYNTILYELTRNGFATVRVEKSGVGDSQGPPCQEVDFETELDGYRAALKVLPRYDFMDTARVILFGHSMGGIAAPILYKEHSLQGIIAMATSANDWMEYELINQRRQLVLEGVEYDSIQFMARQRVIASYELFVEKKTPEEILAAHPDLADYLQYPAHYIYMQQVANLNSAALWKEVDTDVLVVYGLSDFVTDAADHRYLTDLINYYHPGRARYVEVPEMDHFFNKTASQRDSFDNTMQGFPNKTFSDGVLPVVLDFCKSVAAKVPGQG